MNPMLTPGAASWTELMTSDLDASVNFYRAVLGWKIEVAPMSAGPYGVGQVDGKYIAGMMNCPRKECLRIGAFILLCQTLHHL